MNNPVKGNEFYSTKEAGRYLGVSIRTVQRLAKQDRIKCVRFGKLIKFRKADLEKLLLSGTSPAGKATSLIERRKHPRINTNITCNYSINLLPFRNIRSEGIIKNISSGGIFLTDKTENLRDILTGDPVELDFGNGELQGIKTGGRVTRKEENGIIIYGVGIKFRNIDKEYKAKIKKYVG